MKLIPSFAHGVLDYLVAVALIVAPELFGFANMNDAAESVPRTLGAIILILAISTDYELGIFRMISFPAHLTSDYAFGTFLAASPWLFGFSSGPSQMWLPHLLVGLTIICLTALTDPVPNRGMASPTSESPSA